MVHAQVFCLRFLVRALTVNSHRQYSLNTVWSQPKPLDDHSSTAFLFWSLSCRLEDGRQHDACFQFARMDGESLSLYNADPARPRSCEPSTRSLQDLPGATFDLDVLRRVYHLHP
jgi:hypothetical protein